MAYLDLEYGTPKHDKLRDAIRARTRAGRDKLAPRRAKWREAELVANVVTAVDWIVVGEAVNHEALGRVMV